MRIFLYSLLAMLPLMGLPLSAADCSCHHGEDFEAGIHSVSCCQELPADCCVQHRNAEPKQPLFAVAPFIDSFSIQLAVVTTLTEERTMLRPQAGIYTERARPPPLQSSEQRCRLQSWLI